MKQGRARTKQKSHSPLILTRIIYIYLEIS